jgi:hypothetical protein
MDSWTWAGIIVAVLLFGVVIMNVDLNRSSLQGDSIDRYRQGREAMGHVVRVGASIRRADDARMGSDIDRSMGNWDRSHRMDSDEVTTTIVVTDEPRMFTLKGVVYDDPNGPPQFIETKE